LRDTQGTASLVASLKGLGHDVDTVVEWW